MITLVRAANQVEYRNPEFIGLSTDGFPISADPAVRNGARIYFMDSGMTYEYSEDDDDWYEVPNDNEKFQKNLMSLVHTNLEELQEQIDAITSSSDVVDVVGTYADLQLYDTTGISNNDIIKVLEDEENENVVSYYRWGAEESSWGYIGSQSPYFTKAEVEEMFDIIDPQLLPTITEEEDNGKYARIVNGEWNMEYIEFGEIIHAESSTSLNGETIPRLSEVQIQTAYNTFVSGKNVAISSVDGKKYYVIVGVDSSDSDDIKLVMLYGDKYLITYNHLGAVAQFKDILQGETVVLSREFGTAPNDHGFYREWFPNTQGNVWVECGLKVVTEATMAGTIVTIPATFEDTNYHIQVNPAEMGNFHVCAIPVSTNSINVRATNVNGAALAIPVYVEVKGWKAAD